MQQDVLHMLCHACPRSKMVSLTASPANTREDTAERAAARERVGYWRTLWCKLREKMRVSKFCNLECHTHYSSLSPRAEQHGEQSADCSAASVLCSPVLLQSALPTDLPPPHAAVVQSAGTAQGWLPRLLRPAAAGLRHRQSLAAAPVQAPAAWVPRRTLQCQSWRSRLATKQQTCTTCSQHSGWVARRVLPCTDCVAWRCMPIT